MYIGSLKNTMVFFNKLWFVFFGNAMNNGIKIKANKECVEFSIYKKQRVRIKQTKCNNKHDKQIKGK